MTKILSARLKLTAAITVTICAALYTNLLFAPITYGEPELSAKQNSISQSDSMTGSKDAGKAVEILKEAADRGDAAAQTKLGILYENGKGVTEDFTKSAQLYQRASLQGFAAAQFQLANLYEKGEGVNKDFSRALELYQRAAEGGYAPAQFYLGFLYQNGDGVPQDPFKAAELYKKAANQGYATAYFFLGSLYENGTGVPKSSAICLELYQTACDLGDGAAALYLGNMYESGSGVSKDLKKAAEFYSKAADNGSETAAISLKKLQPQTSISAYERGLPSAPQARPEKDDCEKGFEEAMSYVWGLNRTHLNTQEAVERLKSLAKAECAEAAAQLAAVGRQARQGHWAPFVPKDEASAQELANIALADGLAQRADEGRPYAQQCLSTFYMFGLGVTQDRDRAWQLLVQAAEGGSAISQFYLGASSYDPSDGSGKNPGKAVYWYEQAAAQGLADAQFMLGLMHMKGVGVSQNTQKATHLIQQAASQGYERASAELAKLAPSASGSAWSPPAVVQPAFAGTWQGTLDGATNGAAATIVVNPGEDKAAVKGLPVWPNREGRVTKQGNTISWKFLAEKWSMTVAPDGRTATVIGLYWPSGSGSGTFRRIH